MLKRQILTDVSNLCAINASIDGERGLLKITKLLRIPNPFVKYLSLHAFICNIAILIAKVINLI